MQTKVLFICMGNICRSPTAEGVFRHKVEQAGLLDKLLIDSAATHNYHPGNQPDQRSQRHAKLRGYDLSALRARPLRAVDFERFDHLLVMDDNNFTTVRAQMPTLLLPKLQLLTSYCSGQFADASEVPDPYYGDADDFEYVLDLVENACEGLLTHLRNDVAK